MLLEKTPNYEPVTNLTDHCSKSFQQEFSAKKTTFLGHSFGICPSLATQVTDHMQGKEVYHQPHPENPSIIDCFPSTIIYIHL